MRQGLTTTSAALVALIGLHGTSSSTQAQSDRRPTPVVESRFDVDVVNSRVYIKVTSGSRLGHDHGVVGKLESGSIRPGGSGSLVFAMKTFITDTPDARQYVGLTAPVKPADQKKSSSNMLGPDVLDVQRFPRATFDITSFEPAEGQAAGVPGVYTLRGKFTLHGVTRSLTLQARLVPTTDPAVKRLRGAFAISQSHYGITPYSALGGLVSITDKLDVWGEFVVRGPMADATARAGEVTR